jgi:hypothetical protein
MLLVFAASKGEPLVSELEEHGALSAVCLGVYNLVAIANHRGDEVGLVLRVVDVYHHIEGVLRWAAEVEFLFHVVV